MAGIGDAPVAARCRALIKASRRRRRREQPAETSYDARLGAIVFDASAARTLDSSRRCAARSARRSRDWAPSGSAGRHRHPAARDSTDAEAAAAQQALEGITRSIGKELLRGAHRQSRSRSTDGRRDANVVAAPCASCCRRGRPTSTVRSVRVGPPRAPDLAELGHPLTGKVAVVTGAARGIGAAIAEVLARDGATRGLRRHPRRRRRPGARSPTASAAPPSSSTSPPRTPGRGSSSTPGRATAASTSSCTTPASPATSCSPTPTPTAGRQVLDVNLRARCCG